MQALLGDNAVLSPLLPDLMMTIWKTHVFYVARSCHQNWFIALLVFL